MKNMFESAEVFDAYAQIDFCYAMLEEIHKEINKPLAPITRMVYAATGYDKDQDAKNIKATKEYLKTIIKCKKIIEADYTNDQKALDGIKKISSPKKLTTSNKFQNQRG